MLTSVYHLRGLALGETSSVLFWLSNTFTVKRSDGLDSKTVAGTAAILKGLVGESNNDIANGQEFNWTFNSVFVMIKVY